MDNFILEISDIVGRYINAKPIILSENKLEIGEFIIAKYDEKIKITSSTFSDVLPEIIHSKIWKLRFFSDDLSSVPYKPLLRELSQKEIENLFGVMLRKDYEIRFIKEKYTVKNLEDLISKIHAPAIDPSSYSYMEVAYNGDEFPYDFLRFIKVMKDKYVKDYPRRKERLNKLLEFFDVKVYNAVGVEWCEFYTDFGRIVISREVGRENYGIFMEGDFTGLGARFRRDKSFGNAPFINGSFPDSSGELIFLGYDNQMELIKEKMEQMAKSTVFIKFESLTEKEEKIIRLLNKYGSVLLVGPPGTGKTYTARRVANFIAGREGKNWILIQSSQSFEYENFVEGLKPVESSGTINFKVVEGPFLKILNRALSNPNEKFIIIIDEINRGNVAALLGEILYAIEYRDSPVIRPYSSKPMIIPKNLYIIATMNERDSNVIKVDQAILRRFPVVFFEPSEEELRNYLEFKGWYKEDIEEVVSIFKKINSLTNDSVGHTYFYSENLEDFKEKFEHFIKPLLKIHFGITDLG